MSSEEEQVNIEEEQQEEEEHQEDQDLYELIRLVNDGKWSITHNMFFVNVDKPKEEIPNKNQQICQNELLAINTNLNFLIINDNDTEDIDTYKNNISIIPEYQKLLKYFKSLNILSLDSIKDQKMEDINNLLDIGFKEIYENSLKKDYLLEFVSHSDIKKIGEIIQTDANSYKNLNNYMLSIAGQIISENQYVNFINNQPADTIFDSYKLGLKFCDFLYQHHKLSVDISIDSIFQSKNELCRSFPNRITRAFCEKNLLFVKVKRPIYCYHCILSIAKIISSTKKCDLIFNLKTLIFCDKSKNFHEKINNIPKEADTNPDLTYFIVHPEVLNDNDQALLIEFINERMKFQDEKNMTKIIIVTSKDYREPCLMHAEKIDLCEFVINDSLIKHLCELSRANANEYRYQLYYSQKSGSGKTAQIREDFETNKNCIQKDHFLKRIFIDDNLKFIPSLEHDGKPYEYVHFDLSPDIFGENFLIFDQLWILTVLHSHVYPTRASYKTPTNIFFEVPTLNDEVFMKEEVFPKIEFPICVHYAYKISEIHEPIKISETVKHFCDRLFDCEINLTSQLIEKAAEIFYPSHKLKESSIEPGLLKQVNLFMNYFCNDLPQDDETDETFALFLLLLRTNFHIWKLETIFEEKFDFKSFIILVHQNLFSSKSENQIKWTFLNFVSQNAINDDDSKCEKWKTEILKEDIRDKMNNIDDSKLLKNAFFSFLIDNDKIDVYSNMMDYENNQSIFFNIIRSVFYQNDGHEQYTTLVDAVILRKLEQNPNYSNLEKSWSSICDRKKYNIKDTSPKNQWNHVIERIYKIHCRNESNELNSLIHNNKFISNINATQITNIVLTMEIVKRFVIMLIRIILNQAVIFEGSSGVGKSEMMKILKILVDSAHESEDFNWVFHQIDCNDDLNVDKFNELKKYFYENVRNDPNHIIFLDNLNTSPIMNYIVNEINQYPNEENNSFSTVFIAAVNPYVKYTESSQSIPLVGFKQSIQEKSANPRLYSLTPSENNLDNLVYNVKKLPDSAKIYILDSDPHNYIFTYEDDSFLDLIDDPVLNFRNSIFTSSEEIYVIKNIIIFYLNHLINQLYIITDGPDETILKINTENSDDIYTIVESLQENKDDIVDIILLLIVRAFSEIRVTIGFKSVFSYFDVKQFMALFVNFFRKLINVALEQDKQEISQRLLNESIIPYSIVLSIMLSIIYRFPGKTDFETKDRNMMQMKKFGNESTINIRPSLIKILSNVNWGNVIKKPQKDWDLIVKSYSWLKCKKYIYQSNGDKTKNALLLKTDSLIKNLFALSSCYSASKNSKDCVIPCSIIGQSGSSKEYASHLFIKYKKSINNQSIRFYDSKILYTKLSNENCLNAKYRDYKEFMANNKRLTLICSVENIIIENSNKKCSLHDINHFLDDLNEMKLTNSFDDKVFILPYITTCYSLDISTMNRSITIYNETPNKEELAKTMSFSELESKKLLINKKKIINLKNKFFEKNNFFKFDDEESFLNSKYKKFIKIFMALASENSQMDNFSLQPIFLIFNSLFHNNEKASQEMINNLCAYINTIPLFDIKESYNNVKKLLFNLQSHPYFPEEKNKIVHKLCNKINDKDNEFIDYLILEQKVTDIIKNNGCSMYIKTRNYECLDFIESLIQKITKNQSGKKKKENNFHKIFQYNQSMQEIISIIQEAINNTKEIHYVFIIGKFLFSDSFSHFFKISNENENPILNIYGFTIQIDQLPKNIVFCFIENENINQNQISNQFYSKLNPIYLDYNSKDKLKIISQHAQFYNENHIKSEPHAKFANEYYKYFVKNLKNVDEPKEENKFAVIFSVSINEKKFSKIYDINKVTWKKKIIILTIDEETKNFEEIKAIIDEIKQTSSSNKYEITYYWTNEFYDLYNDGKISLEVQIPKPEPVNYKYLKNDGSINILFEQNLVDFNEYFKSIILTTSPISEELKYETKSDENINKNNSIILYDSFFNTSTEIDDKIENIDQNSDIHYIIVRLNKFDSDKDRYIRYLLNKNAHCINIIIIYHLEDSKIPDGLCTSIEWPVFWIESITDSVLSTFSIADAMNCILFNEDENKPIYLKALHQIYDDINVKYEQHITNEKAIQIIQYIFDLFNDKNLFNKSIFSSKFTDKLKGKTSMNSYEQINIKRSFIKEIKKKYPSIENIFEILVLGFDLVNRNELDDTYLFIKNLIETRNIDDLFEKSEIKDRNYLQFQNIGIYFPELILPHVLALYKNFSDNGIIDSPKEIKSTFEIFLKIQTNQNNDNISIFCSEYLMKYLTENQFHIIDNFNDFIEKIKQSYNK